MGWIRAESHICLLGSELGLMIIGGLLDGIQVRYTAFGRGRSAQTNRWRPAEASSLAAVVPSHYRPAAKH